MTPDQARDLLDGTTPGPWHECDSPDTNPRDCHSCSDDTIIGPEVLGCDNPGLWMGAGDQSLILAAPALAAMIASMREEWGVAVTYPGLAEVVEWGYSTQAGALEEVELASTAFGAEYRIVRRYTTEPEENQ